VPSTVLVLATLWAAWSCATALDSDGRANAQRDEPVSPDMADAPLPGVDPDALHFVGTAAPSISLAVACTDNAADVYVSPTNLPPFNADQRGAVVRCSPYASATVKEVTAKLTSPGVVARSGYAAYRIAYRTERREGVAGLATALLYLPDTPIAAPTPLVV